MLFQYIKILCIFKLFWSCSNIIDLCWCMQTNENIEQWEYCVTHSPLCKCQSSLANDEVIRLKHDYWLIWNTMLVFQYFCFLSHVFVRMFSQIIWLLSTAIFMIKNLVIWTQVILGKFYKEKTISSEAELNGKK